ncbi:MAG: SUF system Fe-S cluster assembly protein [Acidobacteria bacterium]|nr:MAG: SUF system Fe-S cluster assembly protein [Acidobacteriota bacterium]
MSLCFLPWIRGIQLSSLQKSILESKVIEALKTCYDPEIPVDIYELGLVYSIEINDSADVHLKMTLTAPGCPVAGSLPQQVESKLSAVEGVKSAIVELVWDPPWDASKMSEAAKLQLGFI